MHVGPRDCTILMFRKSPVFKFLSSNCWIKMYEGCTEIILESLRVYACVRMCAFVRDRARETLSLSLSLCVCVCVCGDRERFITRSSDHCGRYSSNPTHSLTRTSVTEHQHVLLQARWMVTARKTVGYTSRNSDNGNTRWPSPVQLVYVESFVILVTILRKLIFGFHCEMLYEPWKSNNRRTL